MPVHLEVAEGVATIRFDRPPTNALDSTVQNRLREPAEEATDRDDVRAVILYGGEKVFTAGADIKEMQVIEHTAMVKRSRPLQDSFTAFALVPKPVVAAITGYALGGGCELALCADYRIATDNAKLGQPEILRAPARPRRPCRPGRRGVRAGARLGCRHGTGGEREYDGRRVAHPAGSRGSGTWHSRSSRSGTSSEATWG
jgi:hypothetical protein